MSVVYLTYDGLMEPLGESQILPYLLRLARARPITIVSYEKPRDLADADRRNALARSVHDAGIRWIPLRYHKSPLVLSTLYDLLVGLLVCLRIAITGGIRVVHVRSLVMSPLGLALKQLLGLRFIFDTRGFWLDQRIASGQVREGSLLCRMLWRLEQTALRRADVVFVLAPAAVAVARQRAGARSSCASFEVVPTCADLSIFTAPPASHRRRDTRLTLGYAGSASPAYTIEPVLNLFNAIRRIDPSARLKFVNRSDHERIRAELGKCGIPDECVQLDSCGHAEVPGHIWSMDIGLVPLYHAGASRPSASAFGSAKSPTPASVGTVPTRMAEYLACGVPCVAVSDGNPALEFLERERVGVIMRAIDPASIDVAARMTLDLLRETDLAARCVDSARRHFSLEQGVATYEAVYRTLERPV